MIRLAAAAAGLAALAAPASAQEIEQHVELSCAFVGQAADQDKPGVHAAGDFSALKAGQADAPIVLGAPDGLVVQALLCERNTLALAPAPTDYRLPEAGYPLYLETYNDDKEKTGVAKLIRADGDYVYEVVMGELTEPEAELVAARMEAFNAGDADDADSEGEG